MLKIKQFNFKYSKDLSSGMTLKTFDAEFSFFSWKDRLAFAWSILTKKTVRESGSFAGCGPVVMNVTTKDPPRSWFSLCPLW